MTAILAFCLGTAALSTSFAQGDHSPHERPEIWLAGEDPVVQEQKHKHVPADYMDLFKFDAPWPTAASGLEAFKISTQFALRATDDQLRTLINDLQHRRVALAVELGVLVGSDRCGITVEGYASPNAVENVARRIKKLGGQIDYVAMDEPVWMGHVAKGVTHPEIRGAVRCEDSVAALVDQIAPKVAILREIFPNVQIGDIDPVTGQNLAEIDDLTRFADLFRKATNVPLAFVHADIAWQSNWRPVLEELAERVHRRGIRLGVICIGDGKELRNEAWINQAVQRCRAIVADPKIKADALIVQSWYQAPTKMLPETDPGALTYEAVQVLRMVR